MTTEIDRGSLGANIRSPERHGLSIRAKITSAVMTAFLGLTACTPQEIQASYTPDIGGNGSSMPTESYGGPAIEATEVSPVVPESFTEQLDILQDQGFKLENKDGVWMFVEGDSGKEVIAAKDETTVVVKTQSGEELEFPQESFEVKEVSGVGVSAILTLENTDGSVEYFYLNHEDNEYWTTPLEIQANPEVIENYTPIELEDVWSGRLLFSELLIAEPFPEGTAVPDKFVYQMFRFPKGVLIELDSYFDESTQNLGNPGYQDNIDKDNDYRKWVAFYTITMSNGENAIIATQQVLSQDGENSVFFHHIFGSEWPWDRNYSDAGFGVNVIDTVFLARDIENHNASNIEGWAISPAIFFEGATPEWQSNFFSVGFNPPRTTAGAQFYEMENNNPLFLRPDLEGIIEDALQNLNTGGYVTDAGEEIYKLQYMMLLGHGGTRFPQDYFESN